MISIIVAFDENQVIGKNNKLPWHYKDDLKYFKDTTSGHDVLMGRLTFESILSYNNKPLPNRHNIIITHQSKYEEYDVTVIHDILPFLENYPTDKELFVIGGRSIYEQVLPYADRLYITHILKGYEGDTYFPSFEENLWSCIKEEVKGELKFSVYERVK